MRTIVSLRLAAPLAIALTLSTSFTPIAIGQVPTGSIAIEQFNQFQMLSAWSLVHGADQQTFNGAAAKDTVQVPSGDYTFFIQQPKGLVPLLTLSNGTTVLQSVEVPQISFTYDGVSPLKITVQFQIKESGKVGINSEPNGIPFDLLGPSNFVLQGVTPASYTALPLGQYSVHYLPKGCTPPPPKSGELARDGRIDFMISIKCSTLQQVLSKDAKTIDFVSGTVNGEQVAFMDVPKTEWYATYVDNVTRKGVMGGYKSPSGKPLGKFGPNDPVTLAQLARIAHEIAGLNEVEAYRPPVNETTPDWAKRYIASAEQRDWAIFVDATVNVNRPATRGEVLMTLLQALNIPLQWPTGTAFRDVSRRTPYAAAIETAAQLGVVAGSAAGGSSSFGPQNPINRAELAKVLTKFMDKYGSRAGTGSLIH